MTLARHRDGDIIRAISEGRSIKEILDHPSSWKLEILSKKPIR